MPIGSFGWNLKKLIVKHQISAEIGSRVVLVHEDLDKPHE